VPPKKAAKQPGPAGSRPQGSKLVSALTAGGLHRSPLPQSLAIQGPASGARGCSVSLGGRANDLRRIAGPPVQVESRKLLRGVPTRALHPKVDDFRLRGQVDEGERPCAPVGRWVDGEGAGDDSGVARAVRRSTIPRSSRTAKLRRFQASGVGMRGMATRPPPQQVRPKREDLPESLRLLRNPGAISRLRLS
jgi:hypothetical protein